MNIIPSHSAADPAPVPPQRDGCWGTEPARLFTGAPGRDVVVQRFYGQCRFETIFYGRLNIFQIERISNIDVENIEGAFSIHVQNFLSVLYRDCKVISKLICVFSERVGKILAIFFTGFCSRRFCVLYPSSPSQNLSLIIWFFLKAKTLLSCLGI